MKIQLNGVLIDARFTTLANLLEAEGFSGAKIATAVNGVFVPASIRADHILNDNDNVEVLAPMQGG